MFAKFDGNEYIDVGSVIEVNNGDSKGTVIIEQIEDGSREVTVDGICDKGRIMIFINPEGILDRIQVTGDTRTSDTTEYRHQSNGHLSDAKVIKEGMQW